MGVRRGKKRAEDREATFHGEPLNYSLVNPRLLSYGIIYLKPFAMRMESCVYRTILTTLLEPASVARNYDPAFL